MAGLTESFGTAPVVVNQGATLQLHKQFDVTKAGADKPVTTVSVGTDKVRDDAQVVLKTGAVLALADDGVSMKALTVEGPATLDVTGVKASKVSFSVDKASGLEQLKVAYDTKQLPHIPQVLQRVPRELPVRAGKAHGRHCNLQQAGRKKAEDHSTGH